MTTTIAKITDTLSIEFGHGKFDDWCVFLVDSLAGTRSAPSDKDYFRDFLGLAKRYGSDQVWNDFMTVYRVTGRTVDQGVVELIKSQSLNYGLDWMLYQTDMLTVYGGMIAEENKEGAVLGKKMKKLGMYQLLKLGFNATEASKFSWYQKADFLTDVMKSYGIYDD